MTATIIEPGTEWTDVDNRGECIFCGGIEGGYAKKDIKGAWHPACWDCVRPKNPPKPPEPRKKLPPPPDLVIAEPVKVVKEPVRRVKRKR